MCRGATDGKAEYEETSSPSGCSFFLEKCDAQEFRNPRGHVLHFGTAVGSRGISFSLSLFLFSACDQLRHIPYVRKLGVQQVPGQLRFLLHS